MDDAYTRCLTPRSVTACTTANVAVTLVVKMSWGGRPSGRGTPAACTTASTPAIPSCAAAGSVGSASTIGKRGSAGAVPPGGGGGGGGGGRGAGLGGGGGRSRPRGAAA